MGDEPYLQLDHWTGFQDGTHMKFPSKKPSVAAIQKVTLQFFCVNHCCISSLFCWLSTTMSRWPRSWHSFCAFCQIFLFGERYSSAEVFPMGVVSTNSSAVKTDSNSSEFIIRCTIEVVWSRFGSRVDCVQWQRGLNIRLDKVVHLFFPYNRL